MADDGTDLRVGMQCNEFFKRYLINKDEVKEMTISAKSHDPNTAIWKLNTQFNLKEKELRETGKEMLNFCSCFLLGSLFFFVSAGMPISKHKKVTKLKAALQK